MDDNDYLNKRLDNQIKWYSKKSTVNKRWFQYLQLLQIIIAAFIALSGSIHLGEYLIIQILVPILGAIIAIVSGVQGLFKFQENWLEYRTTAESLKHEKFLYQTNSEPYNVDDPLNLLVNRVETLISKENTNWAQYMKRVSKRKQ